MDLSPIREFERQEEQEVKPSTWLRRGIPMVEDNVSLYLGHDLGRLCGCALGTIYAAQGGQPGAILIDEAIVKPLQSRVLPVLGMPNEVAHIVQAMHICRNSREDIAAYLESQNL